MVGTAGPLCRGLVDSREAGGIRGTSGSRGLRVIQEARIISEGIFREYPVVVGDSPEREDRDSLGESIKGTTVAAGGPPATGDKEYGNGHG